MEDLENGSSISSIVKIILIPGTSMIEEPIGQYQTQPASSALFPVTTFPMQVSIITIIVIYFKLSHADIIHVII